MDKEFRADNKRELLEDLIPLKGVEESLSRALENVRNTKLEVEAQGEAVANTIETSFEELHTILETRKQQLLEEAKTIVREKIENLNAQEKNLSIASAGVHSVIDYTEQCVIHCSDEEVMSMHTEISQRIQDEGKRHNKPGMSLEPVEKADMGVEVRCAKDLQQLCRQAKISSFTDYLTVEVIAREAEINKEMNVEVLNICNDNAKWNMKVQCAIKCLTTRIVSIPKIEAKTDGRYSISYIPTACGLHEISISANGHPLTGSPFTVAVYMSPAQLKKPTKVWDSITQPNSIAVNSAGEIIVAEFNEDIVVFDKDGKRLRSIERSKHQVYYLQSVAVDDQDNIYFVGRVDKLCKFNRNCDKLLVREVKQVKGPGYIDITVVEDEVMVTEQCNEGQIKVYDTELNYVREINSTSRTRLRFLCPDQRGNLFVTDNNRTVQVLSKAGDFLRSISCDQKGVQQLRDPWMLHISGQYLYVADCTHRKIVVFTTTGSYVTTFGFYGGICTNKQGILFNGNYFTNSISCYDLCV